MRFFLSALWWMDGWMDGWNKEPGFSVFFLFSDENEARHAGTLPSLTSGRRRYNPTAPNPEALASRRPVPFYLFFLLMRFSPAKKITALLIKCLSCRKVTVIPAPDKATHRDLGALKPADKTAPGEGLVEKIREREKNEKKKKKKKKKKKGRVGGKMDRQLPPPTGRRLRLLQAAHTGTAAATGRLLIYLGPLSPGGRGLIQINAAISPPMCDTTAHCIDKSVIVPFMTSFYKTNLTLKSKIKPACARRPDTEENDCLTAGRNRSGECSRVRRGSCCCKVPHSFTPQLIRPCL